jgi:adenosylcobinamide kinase/adenosylcobinamide-phosphate guanylyltransferase
MDRDRVAGDKPASAQIFPITLVLGGARSGKSRFAERLVESAGGGVYLATGEARDAEMEARIAEHRARRGADWSTVEEPIELAAALRQAAGTGRPVLVDCLTLWLSNLMLAEIDIEAKTAELLTALPQLTVPVIFIANEVGLSIVPDNRLARRFRDEAGILNQRIAEAATRVTFVAAGLPLTLK